MGWMNVVCIGAGYVGSVTAAALAKLGHSVTVIDFDESKIAAIQKGESPIFEPGLSELLQVCIGNTLSAAADYGKVQEADVVFICVGTPSKTDSTVDLTYVKEAAAQIGKHLNAERYTVIVNKSTVPVGTTDVVGSIVARTSGLPWGQAFDVVSNPEFLREGYAVEDVFFPDRILIGTDSLKAEEVMKELYDRLLNGNKTVWLRTSPKSSELIKYASNAFLAVKISYINDMARLCDTLGANVKEVAAGMGLDSRIGDKFLEVSSGWSGSCFPKDTAELAATARKYGCEQKVILAAMEANEQMHLYCVRKIQSRLKSLHGKTISVLGLTFKPNTDDARKTQASVIIRRLCELGCQVKAHDPRGAEMFRKLNPELSIEYCKDPLDTVRQADAILLLTHWDCYLQLDWSAAVRMMNTPYILDTRNVLSPGQMRDLGYQYEGLGV